LLQYNEMNEKRELKFIRLGFYSIWGVMVLTIFVDISSRVEYIVFYKHGCLFLNQAKSLLAEFCADVSFDVQPLQCDCFPHEVVCF